MIANPQRGHQTHPCDDHSARHGRLRVNSSERCNISTKPRRRCYQQTSCKQRLAVSRIPARRENQRTAAPKGRLSPYWR
ncbi:hypothetical protein MAIT1_03410 [Magnetofaba australis IT-1]|uniref:Uncharacterized protein n=1 Tax=Magnetofaba australis IT-1 TaxID=1434232 RepID=A0A1Y2K8X4_9PROT|nr:hypothetical protein MAIT1_03410 [Magnetofaba australis IT-1]